MARATSWNAGLRMSTSRPPAAARPASACPLPGGPSSCRASRGWPRSSCGSSHAWGAQVMSLLAVLGFMVLVMAAAWAWQRRVNDIGWVDVFWTFGAAAAGLGLAWTGGQGDLTRRLLVSAIVVVWAVRLGLYVAVRVATASEGDR